MNVKTTSATSPAPSAGPGRQSKLTPDQHRTLLRALGRGAMAHG